ncbi:MAG TPA: ABC transporter permease [Candidatus Babeliales bacterium]|nr:ABC transporter permease [Candidatus Babeliales bacterium]
MAFIKVVDEIGRYVLNVCNRFGSFIIFFAICAKTLFTTRLKIGKTFAQMQTIGVDSLSIVVLTGTFGGAVIAFQTYIGFKRFGGHEFMGPIVALSLSRELAPVLTGLMVTGRAGSAIAAEIGTMRITEQIDALRTLCINTWQYLVVPRIVASTLMLPFLTLFAFVFGTLGGYAIAVYVLGLNGHQYLNGIARHLQLQDVIKGLFKSSVFGLILAWVGAYKGYNTKGGARGVGRATTQSVVVASIMILIANYFLTAFLF